MKRCPLLPALLLATGAAACGGGSAGGPHANLPAPIKSLRAEANSDPMCSSLIGKPLTKASENVECKADDGTVEATLFMQCNHGEEIAFGDVAGGWVGKPAKAGDYSKWPGCFG